MFTLAHPVPSRWWYEKPRHLFVASLDRMFTVSFRLASDAPSAKADIASIVVDERAYNSVALRAFVETALGILHEQARVQRVRSTVSAMDDLAWYLRYWNVFDPVRQPRSGIFVQERDLVRWPPLVRSPPAVGVQILARDLKVYDVIKVRLVEDNPGLVLDTMDRELRDLIVISRSARQLQRVRNKDTAKMMARFVLHEFPLTPFTYREMKGLEEYLTFYIMENATTLREYRRVHIKRGGAFYVATNTSTRRKYLMLDPYEIRATRDVVMKDVDVDEQDLGRGVTQLTAAEEALMKRIAAQATLPRLLIGGRFEREANTFDGGVSGNVYYAKDLQAGGRRVVVKVVPVPYFDVTLDMHHELLAFRALSGHRNIVTLLAHERRELDMIFVIELAHTNLRDWIDKRQSTFRFSGSPRYDPRWSRLLSNPEKARVMRDIASGTKHLHDNGFVHYDLHYKNVLIVYESPRGPRGPVRALLTDFGKTRRIGADRNRPTLWGSVLEIPTQDKYRSRSVFYGDIPGSPHLPPEMVNPDRMRIPRSAEWRSVDMWSLGGLFVYIVTGGQYTPFFTERGTSTVQEMWVRELGPIPGRDDLMAAVKKKQSFTNWFMQRSLTDRPLRKTLMESYKLSAALADFLMRFFSTNPGLRITADQALQDPMLQ